MNNWTLVSCISLGLVELQEKASWSLSTSEHASFLKSIYENILKNGLPKSKNEIKKLILEASHYTYIDYDETVESLSVEEMKIILDNLHDYIYDKLNEENNSVNIEDVMKYIKNILLN